MPSVCGSVSPKIPEIDGALHPDSAVAVITWPSKEQEATDRKRIMLYME